MALYEGGEDTDYEAFGERDIWLTYGGSTATSMQGNEIFHSANGGATWQLIADVQLPGGGQLKNLPSSGIGPRVTALSPSTSFLSMGRSPLYMSVDGGRSWAPAIDDELASGGAVGDGVRSEGGTRRDGDRGASVKGAVSTFQVVAAP